LRAAARRKHGEGHHPRKTAPVAWPTIRIFGL
jgi:hypothetical protein